MHETNDTLPRNTVDEQAKGKGETLANKHDARGAVFKNFIGNQAQALCT